MEILNPLNKETGKRQGHKNVLNYYDNFEDEENFYIVTELMEGGDLFDDKSE